MRHASSAKQRKENQPAKEKDRVSWIRPLGIVENYYATVSRYVYLNTVQAVWLSSEQPIDAQLVATAVRDVTSTVEALQARIVRRSSLQFWFRRMADYKLNFDISTDDPMTVFDALMHTPFNFKQGPLWKATLCVNPAVPHTAVLLLSLHHGITDGTSNLIILRDIVGAINALYRQEQLEFDFRPIAPALPEELVQTAYHVPYLSKEALKSFFTTIVYSRLGLNPLTVFRGNTDQKTGKIRVIANELSEENTEKLLKRCKEAKVTVNCCVVAAARLALFRLLQFYKPNCQRAAINVENFVNLRRYLPASEAETLGPFICAEAQRLTMSDKDFQDFWKLAKKVNDKQAKHLENKIPLRRIPLFRILIIPTPLNKWFTERGYRNAEVCQLSITNMGNVDKFLASENESHVRVTNYLRSVSDHNGPSMCNLSFQTLRGKFMLSIDHSTNKLTDEMAEKFTHTIMTFLNSIAEKGDIL